MRSLFNNYSQIISIESVHHGDRKNFNKSVHHDDHKNFNKSVHRDDHKNFNKSVRKFKIKMAK